MAGEYLETYTYEYILAQALAQVPNTVDKREGSIIFDAIAPACYELAEFYLQLRRYIDQTYVQTANGEYLTMRATEAGMTRYAATHAVKKATFADSVGNPVSIAVGARFSTVADANSLNYVVTAQYTTGGVPVAGAYELTCETLGTDGNSYVGQLLPIAYISGLATATMGDTITPARDAETDDELRARYLLKLTKKAFGGNVADYDELLKDIGGVGDVQVYAAWNGGGTVKLSVVDADYNAASPTFIAELQEIVDPTGTGNGIGLAPIGHVVTVVAPTTLTVNITATVVVKSGYTLSAVQAAAATALEAHMLQLRKEWGVGSDLNVYALAVYVAQVSATILGIAGVANVTNVQLNGVAADLTLTETSTTQQLPILGTVVLSE